ncbi:type VII secretion protein EccCa [Curtobacterium sp. Csp1]|uniref:type VII secretion protein EccCa n=1 Tax=unclassified Curtobacterium TaxID=257496 RepID=UPI00159838CB|nr:MULTISPECIES: type VII secretion protein EccCa [unclassified Curtobacterium]QKS11738.1 type VII secretion protein EccCa [Curtobacterium sp. csp3]QKS18518.1 type VII secretion protein EccCa [Curtobacterium sp. Csp1]
MTRRLVHRPTRVSRPLREEPTEHLAPPPALPEGPVGGVPIQTLLPVVGSLSSIVMIVVLRNANPVFMVIGAVVLVVALVGGIGMALSQRGNQARTRRSQRERYLDFLERTRTEMRVRARDVRAKATVLNPEPDALVEVVRDPARLWERRRGHDDFLRVRAGVGDVRWFDLVLPDDDNPVQPFDPIMLDEAKTVVRHYASVAGMPVTVDLDRAGHVAVIGDRERVLETARGMIAQLAAFHSPEDLHLALVHAAGAADDWRGFDLLPHAVDDELLDGDVPARRIAPDVPALLGVVGGELADRAQFAATAKRSAGTSDQAENSRLVVFVDDHGHVASDLPVPDADLGLADLQVTTVHLLSDRLHEPSDVTVRVVVEDDTATVTDARREADGEVVETRFRTDRVPATTFETLARELAPLRLSLTAQDAAESTDGIGIAELLGIGDVSEVSPEQVWLPRSPRDFLRVPIGLDDFGAPVLLDLKESAQLGMGPHGICIGATGSGKSEMLRTLVLGLAMSHAPEDLSMVLVDYKGGAAFAPFAGLPHVAGIIDNLEDDAGLIERARASIAGEVVRRQRVLRDADNAPSITHYRELRTQRPDLPPLPHLLLVIDEFGELLTAEPDFIELLMTIGRIGRSIGVHLLLSSQRIEAGRLRGLDTYLSYRLGLRTFSEAESSTILDRPDAFHLPAVPGYGYLKVDTSVYRRFRAGYVSGPVEATTARAEASTRPEPVLLPVFNTLAAEQDPSRSTAEPELRRPETGRALVDEAVERLLDADRTTRPIWLPPLPPRLALSRVVTERVDGAHALRVPLGLLDDPSEQSQRPWHLDLTRAGGHAAVIGAPQSGRSTMLRAVAAATALTATPQQVSIYGLDLTGSGLARIEGFPHVGGVATRADPVTMQRLLEELQLMLAARERVFRVHGVDSLDALRTRHAAGELPELPSAEVVLLVDGYGAVRDEYERFEPMLAELLQRGSGLGVHVVVTLTRWNELRMAVQPLVGTRVELRLNDPADSVVDRKLSQTIRADQRGRAITEERRFVQLALPVMDDVDDDDVADALEALARRAAASWTGPGAAPIRLLPSDYEPAELPDPFAEPDRVPFGLRQDTMQPAFLELGDRDQHLLVFGDSRSGKSTLLRGVVEGLVDRHAPDELVVAVMDSRGGLTDVCPDDYLGGQASSALEARSLAAAIAEELAKRQASNGRGAGPRIVVVVDDFDILASGGTQPLEPLLPYLPSARDLRLHVLLTRPVAGLQRALFDLTLQALRDTGGSTFLMSGERSEGQIAPQVYAEPMTPGRGRMLRRGERSFIAQVAHFRPDGGTGADSRAGTDGDAR